MQRYDFFFYIGGSENLRYIGLNKIFQILKQVSVARETYADTLEFLFILIREWIVGTCKATLVLILLAFFVDGQCAAFQFRSRKVLKLCGGNSHSGY